MAGPDAQKRANLVVSRIIPPVLLGIVVYASYAITKPLCIDYLLHPLPSYNRTPRVGAGAAILVIFYLLLILLIATYLRLLYNVIENPGFLPLGADRVPVEKAEDSEKPQKQRRHRRSRKPRDAEKVDAPVDLERGIHNKAGGTSFDSDSFGLESFYTKDVFVCQEDGRPPYCSACCQFKADRSHHCRELDRCVRKMDHFCPWVGGVVSETSFKFFIQFVFYTATYCTFVLIVSAYFTAELKRNVSDSTINPILITFTDSYKTGSVNAQWCVCIGLSGLFGLFTAGMTLSSLQLAALNLTTIENLSRRSVVWTLAIRVPEHLLARLFTMNSSWAPTFRMVTYPLESSAPAQAQTTEHAVAERHVFAILHTQPGENPFSLDSPLKNMQEVMGNNIIDWFLPLKHSPCADHSSQESAFALGPVVTRLKQEAGLLPPPEDGLERQHSIHSRRSNRHRP
ncbi:Palmitoyltransferase pfa5 [Penicillium waksmanii]|uniref:Palmitoyltransferase pfa5 n=1 Tax=Penicillium waksmanii TaxID=69791 RepID=UPI002548034B|nr:Palmitoyltransferase pfa5 [Penicillium waksmanii]KAJ5966323.1 Palmitoyltransferase pfa5 [Penicillium waksmanii]